DVVEQLVSPFASPELLFPYRLRPEHGPHGPARKTDMHSHQHVVDGGDVREQANVLERPCDADVRHLVGAHAPAGILDDHFAVEEDLAPGWPINSGNHI